MRNHPRELIYKFHSETPHIPHVGDKIVFPESWKAGEWFEVISVHHYVVDDLIVINVNENS